MKKVFSTILLSCFALLLSAEVYYLLPNSDGWNSEAVTNVYDNLTAAGDPKPNQLQWEEDFQPERKAYEWFKDHYNAGGQKVITYKDLKDGRLNADGNLFSTVKVLWIHVDRDINQDALDNLFPQEVRNAIANYVKAGGNVYLSTYAVRLAHLIGRAPVEHLIFGNGLQQDISEDNKNITNDPWKVLANYGEGYDNHGHAVYKYLVEHNQYGKTPITNKDYDCFNMQSGSPRWDRNCLWDIPNELVDVNAFQNNNTCRVLGSWGHSGRFESAGLVEFYPVGDWKGTIIANGLAACSWSETNQDVHCVQHLTRGVLDYLSTSISAEWGALEKSLMRIGGGFSLSNSVTLSSALPTGCTLKFYSNNPEIANTNEDGDVYCNYFGTVTFRAEITGDGINAPKNIMWQANSPELTVYGSSPAKFGYILPYSLHTMSEYNNTQGNNENGNRPDFVSADWFNVNYILDDIGCFLNPRDYNATNLIPQEVEVLWIHNDHVGLSSDQYFTDLGRENFVAALREFVDRGGKVFLSKQGTRLVGDLHLLGMHDADNYVYPSFKHEDNSGYITNNDPWMIKNTYTYDTQTIDYSSHPVYNGLSGYPVLQTNNSRTNNEYLIEQINDLKNYDDYIAAEQQYQCRLLGCYGNGQNTYAGAIFVEFLPRTAGQGTVIMMGAPAYHWTGTEINNINDNLTTLTKNILDYLATIKTDVYTRDVTNGNYGTICLPRASKTITGATMWRAVDKNAEGVVIEQVSAMEAGVPYFFQATADVLCVEMQGETKPAGKANGLVGYIDVEGEMLLVPRGDNFFVLSQNQLYFVDSDVYLPSNYAYVNINKMSPLAPVAGMPRRTMRLPQSENATTALDNMQTTSAPTKIIQNGQVYILRDGHIYTTLGTQVK